jgi:hypothetical protein
LELEDSSVEEQTSVWDARMGKEKKKETVCPSKDIAYSVLKIRGDS